MMVQFASLFSSLQRIFPSKTLSGSSKAVRQIGFNIGKASLVACEVLRREHSVTLERCARVPIQPNEQLSTQVKEFCDSIEFSSNRVNFSLKGQGIVIRFLSFPKMSDKEFRSSIQYEAEKYLPFNVSEVVIDYYILHGGGQQDKTMDIVLVAAKKSEVDKILQAVKPTGLAVNAIDIDIFSCVNALQFNVPEIREHVVGVLDLGAHDTTLCIVNRGNVAFTRDVAFGANDMVEMLRRSLGTSHEEAGQVLLEEKLENTVHEKAIQEMLERLFQELRLSLNYFFNQNQQVTKLDTFFLSGGLAQMKALQHLFSERLETAVHYWDPTAKLELGGSISRDALKPLLPYLPVSVGLAIRAK